MTIQEFWDYVDSIDVESRDDGRYTEEEMYNIGFLFKTELNNSQKREIGGWDYLVTILKPLDRDGNIITKGDTFRQWVKNACYQRGTMEPNVQLLSGKTIDSISFEDFSDKTEEIKQSLYKQQVKTRDHLNAYRELLREDARIDLMKELIQESVKVLPPLNIEKVEKYKGDSKTEAVLLLSDLHIGSVVNNFFNKFNVEIARKRVQEVVNQTIKYCRLMNVTKLHVLNLGDLIENNLHVTARLVQEIDAIEQTMVAAEILSEALTQLAVAIPEVIYRSCLDNHSRFTPDYKQAKDEESFVKLIDWYVEQRVAGTGIVFAEDNLDRHIGMFTLLNGEKFIFAHGHEIDVNTAMQKYTAATYSYIRYIALGHWHSTKMKTFLNTKVFVNGSFKGLDDFAEKHGLFGEPEQTLLIFEGNSLNNITINLKDIQ